MGVKHIFGPGTSMEVIVGAINQTHARTGGALDPC